MARPTILTEQQRLEKEQELDKKRIVIRPDKDFKEKLKQYAASKNKSITTILVSSINSNKEFKDFKTK